MGTEITGERFAERDYARFRERLEQCLSDLEELLRRPGFGTGPVTIGAELELCLVDATASPLPGPSGNVEYFLWLRRGEADPMRPAEELVHAAVRRGPQ